MLGKKIVLILMALCSLLFAVLFYTQDPLNTEIGDEQELFFPNLEKRLVDVTSIQIDSRQANLELINVDGQWLVESKDSYPADVATVRQLLYGVVELEILEVKTSNELLLGEIGLANDDEDSVRIRFDDKGGDPIIDILFGKSQAALSREGRNWFVRQYKSPQSWLVNGELNLYESAYQWVNKTVLSLEAGNLKQIELYPETTDAVRIIQSDSSNDFTIADLAINEKVESTKIEQLVDSVSQLQFDDVRPRSDTAFGEETQAINVQTSDGLIVLILVTDAEKGWIVLQAIAASSGETVNEKAEAYNQLWTDWEYQIPKFKIEQLLNKKPDLISAEESS